MSQETSPVEPLALEPLTLICAADEPDSFLSAPRLVNVAEVSTTALANHRESQPAVCDLAYWTSNGCRMKPRSTVPPQPDSARRLSAVNSVWRSFRAPILTVALDEATQSLSGQTDPVRLFRPPRA